MINNMNFLASFFLLYSGLRAPTSNFSGAHSIETTESDKECQHLTVDVKELKTWQVGANGG